MKNALKNPVLLLLIVAVAHTLFHFSAISEALTIACLSALYGFNLYLEAKKQKPIDEELKRELSEMKSTLNALKIGRAFGK